MSDYSAPAGDAVAFVFIEDAYTASVGDAVDFIFQSGYEESVEESFGLAVAANSNVIFPEGILSGLYGVDQSVIDLELYPVIDDYFLFELDIVSIAIAKNILVEAILIDEQLVFYTPSGIIKLLSNPFILTEATSYGVTLTEVLTPITLTETNQTQVTLTEITESVIITEVL